MLTMNRKNRKLLKVLQMLSAFLLGVIISQIFGSTFCGLNVAVEIDSQNYLLVVLILSAPKNFVQRDTMRETWLSLRPREFNGADYQRDITFVPRLMSNSFLEVEGVEQQRTRIDNYDKWLTSVKIPNVKVPNLKIKHLFAIGTLGLASDVMRQIKSEQKVYNDLLLIDDLQDSYKNLTLKLIKSLHQLNQTTTNFKYVLKCDDDSYVKLDYLAQDLIQYDAKLQLMKQRKETLDNLELYWGYFSGRANIKKSGPWQELNFNLCDHYLPYALGGGYVVSKNLVKFIAEHGDNLNRYGSEDISMGTWLSPFRNIHRRHDVRFDTAYLPRKCKKYHFVLHKQTPKDMREIHDTNSCSSGAKTIPYEYLYDWTQAPTKCCDSRN